MVKKNMAANDLTIEKHDGKIFHKSLVSLRFTFYTDEGDGIMMYDNDDPGRTPLRGYGAEETLIEIVLDHAWIWASDEMIYNIACILEAETGPG